MALYMFQASYTDASIKAMIANKDNRKESAGKAIAAGGGKMLSLYFCFGDYDIIDGLARTQGHRLLKKFGCSERRRLNEKGVSNG